MVLRDVCQVLNAGGYSTLGRYIGSVPTCPVHRYLIAFQVFGTLRLGAAVRGQQPNFVAERIHRLYGLATEVCRQVDSVPN